MVSLFSVKDRKGKGCPARGGSPSVLPPCWGCLFLPAAAEPSCTGLDGFVLAEVMAAVCFQLWVHKALSFLLTPALGKITFQLCNSSSKSCT